MPALEKAKPVEYANQVLVGETALVPVQEPSSSDFDSSDSGVSRSLAGESKLVKITGQVSGRSLLSQRSASYRKPLKSSHRASAVNLLKEEDARLHQNTAKLDSNLLLRLNEIASFNQSGHRQLAKSSKKSLKGKHSDYLERIDQKWRAIIREPGPVVFSHEKNVRAV